MGNHGRTAELPDWMMEEQVASRPHSEAVVALAHRSGRRGYRIAYDLLRDASDAEDAVQEALARACASYARLRKPVAIDRWFYRVITNICMRTLRRRRWVDTARSLWRRTPGGDEPQDPAESIVDSAPGPDVRLERRRAEQTLARAVDRLSAMQKAAFVLRYLHELGIAEIAEMLAVGPGTVRTHLRRALEKLRSHMEETL